MAQHGIARCFNPDGTLAWESPVGLRGVNGLTTEGLNAILDGNVFGESLYFGLIANAGFSALAVGDTMASHAGWVEEHANYSHATRPEWNYGSASGGLLQSTSSASFTFTIATTIKGFFLTTNSTKNGTTGTLVATAVFTSGVRSMAAGQTVTLDFLLRAAEGG
jgi:hypothetical protein